MHGYWTTCTLYRYTVCIVVYGRTVYSKLWVTINCERYQVEDFQFNSTSVQDSIYKQIEGKEQTNIIMKN